MKRRQSSRFHSQRRYPRVIDRAGVNKALPWEAANKSSLGADCFGGTIETPEAITCQAIG